MVVAKGVYIESSFFGHSCKPNALRRSEGIKCKIVALDTIDTEKNDVTVSFIPLMETRANRQINLIKNYNFDCTCKRCGKLPYDDELCDKYSYLREKLQVATMKEQHKEAHCFAKEAADLCERVLGRYSILGTVMQITALDSYIEAFIAGELDRPHKKDFKKKVLKVRESICVTHGLHIESFKDDVAKFEGCLEML